MFGVDALKYLIDNCEFKTVLDVGCGAGEQSKVFQDNNKSVTELDFGNSIYTKNRDKNYIVGNYIDIKFKNKFDVIWVCHVLEHQLNVNLFLKKVHTDLKEGGLVSITVPPKKDKIVGGHVTLWNSGLLLYNLVLAGFDCSEVKIKKYGYNISIILKKKSIKVPEISYDCGDIERLKSYFPKELLWKDSRGKLIIEGFNGKINELNWN